MAKKATRKRPTSRTRDEAVNPDKGSEPSRERSREAAKSSDSLKQFLEFAKKEGDQWEKGKELSKDLPEDSYIMRLSGASASVKKAKKEPLIVFTFIVVVGEHKGQQVKKFFTPYGTDGSGSPIGAIIFCKDLETLGFKVDTIKEPEDFVEVINAINGSKDEPIYVRVGISYKQGDDRVFQQVFINTLLESGDIEGEELDGSIPF